MKEKYFKLEESQSNGKYIISADFSLLPLTNTNGSFNIICARLFNLSYADYLRMCRDLMGAEIIGKGHLYPVAYFERNELTYQFLKLLNGRAQYALKVRNFPDLEEKYKQLCAEVGQ